MKFELRYTVFKNIDIEQYLTEGQRAQLADIGQSIDAGRSDDMRGEFGCLVIEQDWPEFGSTLRNLSVRVDKEAANAACERGSHLARYPR